MEAGWKAAVRYEFSQRTLGESHSHWAGGGSDRTGVGQLSFSLLGSLGLLEGDFVGRSGFLACRLGVDQDGELFTISLVH